MNATTTSTVRDYCAGRPEARTSYSNQRGLAARDPDGCLICRSSGSVLLAR